ncbi:hypothetical protein DEAC_c36850 [Desulfosporosinus acididurans]|uniref:Uncharacterized protein n=1 Tax=Desulfosporosinus acididurans TaxID=476652 RepID=A0A0J1FNF0_9FIRM|nr:hypothetical protein [Desulfosporosinus acididurans]KLU64483.1 hypothetical protein DEAC_c36850 [Desulfosporosinus acididurans]
MKSKSSLRKKVIVQAVTNTVVILISGVFIMRGQHDTLSKIISIIDVVFFVFSFIYTNRKSFETKDEMTKYNQLKAASCTFTITLCLAGLVMAYGLFYRTSVTISMINLVYMFVSMYMLNTLFFLFYDVRGN